MEKCKEGYNRILDIQAGFLYCCSRQRFEITIRGMSFMDKGRLLVLSLLAFSSLSFCQSRTGSGEAAFFDSAAYSDAIRLILTNVSAPAGGKTYIAWLGADDDLQYLKLGQLTVQGNGSVSLVYKDNSSANLVSSYKKFIVTEEASPFSGSTPTLTSLAFADSLAGPGVPGPSSNLKRIRNCIATFSNTALNLGLAVWMKKHIKDYTDHSGFARDGMKGNNIGNARTHSDHVFDFIRGALTGLVSGNSSVAANGDPVGYGYRRYGDQGTGDSTLGGGGVLGGAGYYVGLVLNDPNATPQMKNAGSRALLAFQNALGAANNTGFGKEVTDRALNIINGVYATGNLVTEGDPFYALALKFLNGTVSASDTGATTGSVVQAYYHIQRMATFVFSSAIQPTSVERVSSYNLPEQFGLDQNYPNPFNGFTTITFGISSPGRVNLSIYNVLGQEVTQLVQGHELPAGVYRVTWNSGNAVSGTYFLKFFVTGDGGGELYRETRQMVLVK